jgi:hypothetical protein
VTVNDTQPPAIACPANIVTTATTTQGSVPGAIVSYAAPGFSDNCPGAAVACVPASGSFFPVGANAVTCTATDAAGNATSCTFTITVGSPFTACIVDDATGNTLSIVADSASPLYGFWQLRVAATGAVTQGTAEYLVYIPGRSLSAYDHDSTTVRMDLTVNYNARTGTATVKNLTNGATVVVRDRNTGNNPPC